MISELESGIATNENTGMATDTVDSAIAQLAAELTVSESTIVGGTLEATVLETVPSYFDFFGLPRELRDKIYEQPVLLQDKDIPEAIKDEYASTVKKLCTSLLLVSRQFGNEYRDRCAAHQAVEYCIFGDYVKELEVLNEFLCFWAASDPALHSIDVKIYFSTKYYGIQDIGSSSAWDTLLNTPGVRKCEIVGDLSR